MRFWMVWPFMEKGYSKWQLREGRSGQDSKPANGPSTRRVARASSFAACPSTPPPLSPTPDDHMSLLCDAGKLKHKSLAESMSYRLFLAGGMTVSLQRWPSCSSEATSAFASSTSVVFNRTRISFLPSGCFSTMETSNNIGEDIARGRLGRKCAKPVRVRATHELYSANPPKMLGFGMDKKEKVTHFNIGTLEAGAGRHPDLYKGVKLVSFSFSDKLLSEEEMKSLTEPDATSLGKEL